MAWVEAELFERGVHRCVSCCQCWTVRKGLGVEGRGEVEIYVHIVPVRFKPSTTTFIGMVRTEGRVSTRRGFCWGDMLA